MINQKQHLKKYSVLTFNIGKYELLHEIPTDCLNPSIEYICYR